MLIGTAGHIDHGKTSLIRRLTGRNTDRLPEEQRRGISIELGYAYVPLGDAGTPAGAGTAASDGADVLGFIDVPGHEKFVHTMLAGATGIDLALLVVAADDGVMPQTEEHLDILRLLDVREGAIALTKIDAADPARVDAVRAQLARWLAGSPQATWPVFAVSSTSGAGIAGLDAFLRESARTHAARAADGHFRLAVDRVFTLAGIGTVVTGTAHAGTVTVGDEIVIRPADRRARVRSLHAQDRPAAAGAAGQRLALALTGIARDDVERGDWVQAPELDNVRDRFDATLLLSAREAKALKGGTTVHLHHGTRDVLARVAPLDADARAGIEPGARQLVTVSPAAPMALCAGDRFVLRDVSAQRTLGGGVVLDTSPPQRGKRRPERLQLLAALRDTAPVEALRSWLAQQPVERSRLRDGWNLRAAEIDALRDQADAHEAAGHLFARAAWETLRARLLAAVTDAHKREPEMPGLEQNRLRRIAAPQLAADVVAQAIEDLLAAQSLARRGAFLALPAHRAELGREERVRWERIKPMLMNEPFNPPRVRDIARASGIPEVEVRTLLRRVARVGDVMLVALDHYFLAENVAKMADIAAEIAQRDGVARAGAFRDRLDIGRKVAIQILEFFDRVGFTRRVRDDHVVRRDNPWRSGGSVNAENP
jgi:selenocysteine-specific elongation factor